MVETAEYWKSVVPHDKHSKDGRLDIYTSALNLNGILYAITLRFKEPNSHTKEMAEKYGDRLPDNYYKEHRIDEIEIEIAPAHNGASTIGNNGGSRPEPDESSSTGAISKISLGVLLGYVKASIIAKNAFYDRDKSGNTRGIMKNLLDGRHMIALFENHEPSTVLHEMAHFWLEELRDAQSYPSCAPWAKELWHDLEDAYEFDRETITDSRWMEVQERFALEFEDYCREGKAPVTELQPAFDKIKKWVVDICDAMSKIVKNDKIRSVSRRVFDVILNGERNTPAKPAYSSIRM